MNDMKEDRGELDLTLLIEKHQKQIWEYKQRESEGIKTDNMFKGSQKIINELSAKLIDQVRIIAELKKELADKNK